MKWIFFIVLISLTIFFLIKDYRLNWKPKKWLTGSIYSQIANGLGIGTMVNVLLILQNISNEYFNISSETTVGIIQWLAIPILTVLIVNYLIYFPTHYIFGKMRQKNK